jgi:hypothetical protein
MCTSTIKVQRQDPACCLRPSSTLLNMQSWVWRITARAAAAASVAGALHGLRWHVPVYTIPYDKDGGV